MVSAIEPLLRAKLLLALVGLVALGIGMAAMIVLGGRFARRVARTPLPKSRLHDDRWYAKPLVTPEPDPTSTDGNESDPGQPTDPAGPGGP